MRQDVPRKRPKHALAHLGGPATVAGDEASAEALAYALDVGGVDRDRLTHGFHSYPGRMHWATAARVLERLAKPGARVLDPFAGSGTVLVEAMVAGHEAVGVDLNPLAVRLARLKSTPLEAAESRALLDMAQEVAERSEERVRTRAKVTAQLSPAEVRWYEPHVLKELAGLLAEIEALSAPAAREALTLVFSSLVVKFSRQSSDTREAEVTRHLRKGLVTEFFLRKTSELCERRSALSLVASGKAPRVALGDARALPKLLPRQRFDLVLTSPPYGGTYDYVAHHARRFAWLGIDARRFETREIGARRRGASAESYVRELGEALYAMRGVLSAEGAIVLLMGDAQHDGERVAADELIEELAPDVGLSPVALASQQRPDFTGGGPRREHLMLLRATPNAKTGRNANS